MKKNALISKAAIRKAVAQSSKMEGLSLTRARKNTEAIKRLKSLGRGFSL